MSVSPFLASLLILTAAQPASAQAPLREDIAVEGRAIYPIQRQFQVRDCEGEAVSQVDASDLRVLLVPERSAREVPRIAEGVTLARRTAPIALTLVIDTSLSMNGTERYATDLAWELFRRLAPTDRFRLITFASDARWNSFTPAESYLRAAVLAHLTRAVSARRVPGWLPDGLAATRGPVRAAWLELPDAARDARFSPESAALLGRWFDGADETSRERVIESALRSHFGVAFSPSGSTNPDPAFEEAFDALLRPERDDFIPAFDANLGLVVLTDEGGRPGIDPTMRALLSVLLVQHWMLFPRGGGADSLGHGRGIDISNATPSAVGERVIGALRAVQEVRLEVDDAQFTRPGGLRVEWIGERSECHRVVIPGESLPPREVFDAVVASTRGATARERRRDFLDRLAAASPSVREALRGVELE